MMTSAPTFIVGPPRSGTSLLRALLDGHPDLLVLPFESHLFDWVKAADPVRALLDRTRLWPTLEGRGTLSGFETHTPDEVVRTLGHAFQGVGDSRGRLLALVRGWGDLVGVPAPSRWVEKTPRHLFELPTFFRWFPEEARILVMERDPRDVLASQLAQRPSRSVFAMSLSLRISREMQARFREDPRVMTVRFEELVAETAEVMGQVASFLEVADSEELRVPTVLGAAYGGNSRFDETHAGVSSSPVGRFRKVMGPGQLARSEILLGPLLTGEGCPPVAEEGGGGTMPRKGKEPGRSGGGNGGAAPGSPGRPGARHLLARAVLEAVLASGLWRIRALRDAFRGV